MSHRFTVLTASHHLSALKMEARALLSSFGAEATVPKYLVVLSFSRSSGPGAKLIIRSHCERPSESRAALMRHGYYQMPERALLPRPSDHHFFFQPYYVRSTQSFSSSASRSQAANVDDVRAKVCATLGSIICFVCLNVYLFSYMPW